MCHQITVLHHEDGDFVSNTEVDETDLTAQEKDTNIRYQRHLAGVDVIV